MKDNFDSPEDFYAKLKAAVSKSELTKSEIATKFGLKKVRTLDQWLKGDRKTFPSDDQVKKAMQILPFEQEYHADILRVDGRWLFVGEDIIEKRTLSHQKSCDYMGAITLEQRGRSVSGKGMQSVFGKDKTLLKACVPVEVNATVADSSHLHVTWYRSGGEKSRSFGSGILHFPEWSDTAKGMVMSAPTAFHITTAPVVVAYIELMRESAIKSESGAEYELWAQRSEEIIKCLEGCG
jgi:transcriptional regulator with XRE-family HTH domain